MSSISLIICTRNRCVQLAKSLDCLGKMTLPKNLVEVVIIDNGSSDATRDVVNCFNAKVRLDVRYVFEGRKGL